MGCSPALWMVSPRAGPNSTRSRPVAYRSFGGLFLEGLDQFYQSGLEGGDQAGGERWGNLGVKRWRDPRGGGRVRAGAARVLRLQRGFPRPIPLCARFRPGADPAWHSASPGSRSGLSPLPHGPCPRTDPGAAPQPPLPRPPRCDSEGQLRLDRLANALPGAGRLHAILAAGWLAAPLPPNGVAARGRGRAAGRGAWPPPWPRHGGAAAPPLSPAAPPWPRAAGAAGPARPPAAWPAPARAWPSRAATSSAPSGPTPR